MQDIFIRYNKVAVLMGGTCSEREISLISGKAVLDALQSVGVDAVAIDWNDDGIKLLKDGNFSAVFIMLHGGEGEDGTVQAILEALKIPYTGSGVSSCMLAMDKVLSKRLWQALGVSTLPFKVLTQPGSELDLDNIIQEFQFPIGVKAASQGSSIGVYCATNRQELSNAIKAALDLDKKIIIEPWISHKEYTVGFYQNAKLPVIRIESATLFYDYTAKYKSNSTQYHCPSGLPYARERQIYKLAERAFYSLGCYDWGRVDLVEDKDGNFYVLEVNTVPGMTKTSLLPKAAKAMEVSFEQLVLGILNNATLKNEVFNLTTNIEA